jgi:hypothetical protein
MFDTLGTSMPYGMTTISGDACGSDVIIELTDGALPALNAAIGDHIVMGGRLEDLHAEPGMPPAELAFAYTDIPHEVMPLPRLELEIIPEPASAIAIGIAGLWIARRRR